MATQLFKKQPKEETRETRVFPAQTDVEFKIHHAEVAAFFKPIFDEHNRQKSNAIKRLQFYDYQFKTNFSTDPEIVEMLDRPINLKIVNGGISLISTK